MRFGATLSSLLSTLLVVGCSSTQPCEDILEVQRQEATCQELARIMRDEKHPQQALTARKRYDSECVDLRYYRDGYDTICKGEQKPIGNREN